MTDICFTPARKLAQLIRARKLSAAEVMKAFIAQIERVNPKVNAIVTFLPEAALAAAKKFDRNFKADKSKPLAGLPIAYKDNVPTRGIRTTSGSPVFKDHVPKEDHVLVERLTAAGAITIGKTNLPEFAAGSHTFNPAFGEGQCGTRPGEGRKPTTLQKLPGLRSDAARSPPSANGSMPQATAAAAPPEEPPALLLGS